MGTPISEIRPNRRMQRFRGRGDLYLLPVVQGIVQSPRRIRRQAGGLPEMRARDPHCQCHVGDAARRAAPGDPAQKEEGRRLGIEFDERITYVDLKKKIEAAQAAKPTGDGREGRE